MVTELEVLISLKSKLGIKHTEITIVLVLQETYGRDIKDMHVSVAFSLLVSTRGHGYTVYDQNLSVYQRSTKRLNVLLSNHKNTKDKV
jgi:hypothetical protein